MRIQFKISIPDEDTESKDFNICEFATDRESAFYEFLESAIEQIRDESIDLFKAIHPQKELNHDNSIPRHR